MTGRQMADIISAKNGHDNTHMGLTFKEFNMFLNSPLYLAPTYHRAAMQFYERHTGTRLYMEMSSSGSIAYYELED